MFGSMLKKIFGSKNDRVLKKIQPQVESINRLEEGVRKLDDAALAAMTVKFRERLAKGEALDALLPEAFAVCREASRRVLGMRHFDVQLLGGVVLHQGRITEMKTGEGKTLVATLPVYLNALTGRGVHVVTVNDYLARRDAEWMGELYRFLGLSVGSILHGMDDAARKASYACDVTYGTNNEFGFDYLRDNMKFDIQDFCQRGFFYAIVDEVDSILIDEARTPLIISGPAEMSTELYEGVDRIAPKFRKEEHYTLDEKARSVSLTEEGVSLGEKLLGIENLYDPRNIESLHHLNQALKAHIIFKRDVDYLVQDGQVVIVDEFTGRAMPGRRFSDGLHQALEAKERVKVERENQTLASITFQNYFRMYEKLSGMTGTADTEAAEFKKIYNLDVLVIPTHNTMVRKDYADVIYKNAKAKERAIIREIRYLHEKGQPVLVGTINIDFSEKISALLKKEGIPHSVLNAKQHAREAEIVAEAGHKGRVTIATNMAGRGTDIKLGEGVTELGGLHILGTSRHESRRIDNQLRGRAGRQGDPGSSRFYLSLEDDLLRIFGSDRISGIMEKLGMEEDEPIEHTMISRAIENAQRKVEGHNFDIRKHLLEYDDVMNRQREVIYRQRREVLASEDVHEVIEDMLPELTGMIADEFSDEKVPSEEWAWQGISDRMLAMFGFAVEWSDRERENLKPADLDNLILAAVKGRYARREEEIGVANMRHLERVVLLQIVDTHWKEHLLNMDHLKEGIGLRGYGQKNPLNEYKKEGFDMFAEMINAMKAQTVGTLLRIQLVRSDEVAELERVRREQRQPMQLSRGEDEEGAGTFARDGEKTGRNAACPCGSGQKYKRCCGKK
jgi:preprotein translocase subunit SecA